MKPLLSNVPGAWTTALLREVCQIVAGPSSIAKFTKDEGGDKVIAPQNIVHGRVDLSGAVALTDEGKGRFNKYQLVRGDVVGVRTGKLGVFGVYWHEEPGYFNSRCLRIRPQLGIEPDYLSSYLSHPDVTDWIRRNSTGSAISGISVEIMNSMPVSLPDLAVQREIADAVRVLDDKIVAHQEIVAATVSVREALLPMLFTDDNPLGKGLR
jgi:type I restriction enzyme S subunit